MNKSLRLYIVITLIILIIPTVVNAISLEDQSAGDMRALLRRAAAYCEKIKEMAFDFYCHERITEEVNRFKSRRALMQLWLSPLPLPFTQLILRRENRNSFVYDYQMVQKIKREAGERVMFIDEKRVLMEENGRKRKVKNALLKTRRAQPKYLVFGPVGFLSNYWQRFFDYKIAERTSWKDRQAVVISATPKNPMPENYNRGLIWLDARDGSIIKVEWEPVIPYDFDDRSLSDRKDMRRLVTWSVIYDMEKNRVKFPSESIIMESYIDLNQKAYLKSVTRFNYTNYKFFVVGSQVLEEKVKK